MARPRVPLRRIFGTAAIVAIPGLLTLAGISALGVISIQWLALSMILCIFLASIVGYILGGDLTSVAAYGDALSHNPDTPEPRLSGWGPAASLASGVFRRVFVYICAVEYPSSSPAAPAELIEVHYRNFGSLGTGFTPLTSKIKPVGWIET